MLDKLKAIVDYMRARANERSTWAFWIGGTSTVMIAPFPANLFIGLALFFTGFLPDGTVLPQKTDG